MDWGILVEAEIKSTLQEVAVNSKIACNFNRMFYKAQYNI